MRAVRLSLVLPVLLGACNFDRDITLLDQDTDVYVEPSIDHGSWLSMAAAPDGRRLVMAYYDRTLGGLGFATGTPQDDGTVTWLHEQVDGYSDPESGLDVGDRGQFASMKVAPNGTVWIAYYDARRGNLHYAHRVGGPNSWVTGIVDQGSGALVQDAGRWASLALDRDGSPVIAYYDAGNKNLKVARPATDITQGTAELQWTTEVVRTGEQWVGLDAEGSPVVREADVGQFARLMIDGATEYIAYYDAAQQRLGLLEGGPGAYNHTWVTPEGQNMGQWPSMLIANGTLHLAFHDVGNQDLVVATRGAGGYTLETADWGEFVGADTELFLRAGNLAVVYFDGHTNDMKLAERTGTVWVRETLGDANNAVGFHNEIARAGEAWWAASYDFTNRRLFLTKVPDQSAN